MPQRAHWNGFLKLSLVSCPIALYPAISAEKRISFRQVNRQTGNRLRHQLVDDSTGEIVGNENQGRGYEVGDDQFVLVDDEDLHDALEEARTRPYSLPSSPLHQVEVKRESRASSKRVDRSRPPARPSRPTDVGERDDSIVPTPTLPRPINNRTIELDRFVGADEIDPLYIHTPYYIVPREEMGEEAFAVIRDAMREKGVAGMGRVVLQKRERPIVVAPLENGICGFTLRYAHEVRKPSDYFSAISKLDLPQDMVEMATLLIDRKAGAFDTAYLEDRYRTVLAERLKEKTATLSHRTKSDASAPRQQNVIDLMAALKRSVGKQGIRPARPTGKKSTMSRAAAASKRAPAKRARSRSR